MNLKALIDHAMNVQNEMAKFHVHFHLEQAKIYTALRMHKEAAEQYSKAIAALKELQ